MALQSAGGASLPFWGGSYSPLRSATLAVEERDETSPRSSPRARPESAASLPSAGGAAAASFWATETLQEENLAHLEGVGWWQMPLCYFFALLLWAMLFLAYLRSDNRAAATLRLVLLWYAAFLVLVPLGFLIAKAIMGSRIANGLKALSDFVLKMELKVERAYVDFSQGLICIDALQLKNPPDREWRSPYLMTAKRIRCRVLLRDFALSGFRQLTIQELHVSGVELIYEKTFNSSNLNEVLTKIGEIKDNLKPPQNRPPDLTLREVWIEDIFLRIQGLVGARANIAVADLCYQDFSEEVGPVRAEFLVVLLLKTLLKSALSNVLGLDAFRSLIGYGA